MKIIHFADLHIGVESYGKIDPETGLSSRVIDVLKVFDSLVDYAIDNKVDLVVFCGDTYKSRDPSQTHQREFAKRLKRLSEADVPVFLLVGNHDLPNAVGRATALEIFRTLAVSNIYVGADFDIYRIPTKSGIVQILALPWLKRSVLMAREDMKNLTIDQLNERLQELMTERLFALTNELDLTLPALLVGHVWVYSAKRGSEKTMLVGREPVLLPGNIAQPVFDYVALGHIHNAQILGENPPVIYSGSLERLDFSDEKERKGFYVIDINNVKGRKTTSYEFHEVNARRFLSIEVSVGRDDPDPTATVIKQIEISNIKDAVIKLQITLPKNMEIFLKDAEIYKALKESYYFTIGKEFKQEENPQNTEWASEELTPLEALTMYLESKKISEERKKTLLEYGESIIKEISGA